MTIARFDEVDQGRFMKRVEEERVMLKGLMEGG